MSCLSWSFHIESPYIHIIKSLNISFFYQQLVILEL